MRIVASLVEWLEVEWIEQELDVAAVRFDVIHDWDLSWSERNLANRADLCMLAQVVAQPSQLCLVFIADAILVEIAEAAHTINLAGSKTSFFWPSRHGNAAMIAATIGSMRNELAALSSLMLPAGSLTAMALATAILSSGSSP